MIEFLNKGSDSILAIKASGVLTHDDYEKFIPLLDVSVRDNNHVNMFVDISEFESITPHAMLDDFMVGMRYWFNFDSVAIIGDKKWEEYLVKFYDLVTPCDIKFFKPEESDAALKWLEESV